MSAAWFCDAHRIATTGDCPRCDAEQIADLERVAKTPSCHTCKRSLAMEESAWASDWTVIEAGNTRTEVRYTCDDCEAAK